MTDDQFVTRAKFDAMVAERDALATAGWEVLARVAELTVERDALAARVAEMQIVCNQAEGSLAVASAQLAAAHGLQARAERAEAALRKFIAARADGDLLELYRASEAARAALAAVPSC